MEQARIELAGPGLKSKPRVPTAAPHSKELVPSLTRAWAPTHPDILAENMKQVIKRPRPKPNVIEGPAAFNRFQDAVKAILKVSKADLPPSPFGKRKAAKKKAKPKRG